MTKRHAPSGPLGSIRNAIDKLDTEILHLLNQRAKYAIEVAGIKRKSNLQFHSPERERAIIERISGASRGPFPDEALRTVYREIISASLSLEEPLRIAFLGPDGTFTHLAAVRHFGSSARFVSCESIKAVFDAVESNEAEYGLVPIENSIDGAVTYTLDLLMDYDLKISAEVMLEINQNLLSTSGIKSRIKRIYSFAPPVAQCRAWLESNMSSVPILEASSTARAAELAAKHDDAAAIASELAARLYGLKFVKRSIQDRKNNRTRFLVIAKHSPQKTGNDKTSIVFSIKDRPGALYDVLFPFKSAGINLTKIESRPSKRRAWEYIFFVDLEGHIEDDVICAAMEEVKDSCQYLNHLGSYPIEHNSARKRKQSVNL